MVAQESAGYALLAAVAENARRHGWRDVQFLVLAETAGKTEAQPLEGLTQIGEYACEYWSRRRQLEYLEPHSGLLARHLGMDGQDRRLVGLLRAYERGVDLVVLLGEVALPEKGDFLAGHARTGTAFAGEMFGAESGWFPHTRLLEREGGGAFYPRGYPLDQRWRDGDLSVAPARGKRVAASVGLCAGAGDVDAFTRLEAPVEVKLRRTDAFGLTPGSWSAFRADNLCLAWEAVPGYFLSPFLVGYNAVWAGYLLQRLAQENEEVLVCGEPWVIRKQSPLDAWHELDRERAGVRRTSGFAAALRSIALTEKGYRAGMVELAGALEKAWPQGALRGAQAWSGYEVEWRLRFLDGLKGWVEAVESVAAQAPARLLAAVEQGQGKVAGVAGSAFAGVHPKTA